MNNPPLIYTPHPDAAPETEVAALAAIYRYALDRYHDNKKAGVSTTRDDEKGTNDEFLATPRIP